MVLGFIVFSGGGGARAVAASGGCGFFDFGFETQNAGSFRRIHQEIFQIAVADNDAVGKVFPVDDSGFGHDFNISQVKGKGNENTLGGSVAGVNGFDVNNVVVHFHDFLGFHGVDVAGGMEFVVNIHYFIKAQFARQVNIHGCDVGAGVDFGVHFDFFVVLADEGDFFRGADDLLAGH